MRQLHEARRASVDILGHTTHHAGELALELSRRIPLVGRHAKHELQHRSALDYNFRHTLGFVYVHKEKRPVEVTTGKRRKRETHIEWRDVDVYTPDPKTGAPTYRIVDSISDAEQQKMRAELPSTINPAILNLAYQLWGQRGENDPRLRQLREESVATYRMGLLVDRDEKLERFPETQPKRAAPKAVGAITSVINLGTDLAALSAGAPLGGHIARSLIRSAIVHFGIPKGVEHILPEIIWDNGWVPVLDYSLGFDRSLRKAQDVIRTINPAAYSLLYPAAKSVSNEDALDQLMKAVYYLTPGVEDQLPYGDSRRLRFRHENEVIAAYEYYGRWLEQNVTTRSQTPSGRR